MEMELYNLLINKGIINIGTEVTIPRRGQGLDQKTQIITPEDAEVYQISESGDSFRIGCRSVRDGKRFVVQHSAVIKVDGMEPDRIATAFRVAGKKRGRKVRAK